MILHRNRIVAGLLLASLATSCAPSLSRSERNSLTAIRMGDSKTRPDAYHAPQSITLGSASTIGFVSGLAFGLVGGAIATAGVAAKQQGFESKHKSEIDLVKNGTPKDLGEMVSKELGAQLGTDAFFGPRLKAASPSAGRITVEVLGYTLQKTGSGNHSPSMGVIGKIIGPHGEDYYATMAGADGYSRAPTGVPGCSAPLATYAANPALLRTHYQQVAAQAARNLAAAFKEEVGTDEEEDEEDREDREDDAREAAENAAKAAAKAEKAAQKAAAKSAAVAAATDPHAAQ